jgi:hypothetical protein
MSFAGKKEFLRFLTFHVRCQFDFVAASAHADEGLWSSRYVFSWIAYCYSIPRKSDHDRDSSEGSHPDPFRKHAWGIPFILQ